MHHLFTKHLNTKESIFLIFHSLSAVLVSAAAGIDMLLLNEKYSVASCCTYIQVSTEN